MTQCREGMTLENGVFLVCPQEVEGHRRAHGPFTFMFHKGPTGEKHLGWADSCTGFGCDVERAQTLVANGAKKPTRPKGNGWELDGISAASPSSLYTWTRPWPSGKGAGRGA